MRIVTLGLWGALRGAAKGVVGKEMILAPDTWPNNLLTTLSLQQRWMLFPPGMWIMLALAVITALMLR